MSSALFMFSISLSLWVSILLTPRHILSTIMTLEMMSLTLIMTSIIYVMSFPSNNIETFLAIVTLSVSEAAISLAILVSLVQSWGVDKSSTLHLIEM